MSFESSPVERIKQHLGIEEADLQPLTPDASTRSFFRIPYNDSTAIACLYPEPFDSSLPQIDVTELFLAAGLPVAEIFEFSGRFGIVIHEDFGDSILSNTWTSETKPRFTDEAIDLLGRIQAATDLAFERDSIASNLRFDHEKLFWEMEFFRGHYFGSLHKRPNESKELIDELSTLSREIETYSCVLTHRDFHAANLMLVDDSLRIIDHQDARIGPATYDLVSLILDRIDELPSETEITSSIERLQDARDSNGLKRVKEIEAEFDLVAIQRCLKAIGTFSNQSANAGKHNYLKYVAPMFRAVERSCTRLGRYPLIMEMASREALEFKIP